MEYFDLSGSIHQYTCKFLKTTNNIKNTDEYFIGIGGKDKSCITFSATCRKGDNVEYTYLDRVEFNSSCSNDKILIKGEGTKDMLKTALWFVKTKFPQLKAITLMDDSHIECIMGKRQYKLPLAHDYILKKNKTWYEHFFKAELPPSIMKTFTVSLQILDNPCNSLFLMKEKGATFLEEFKDIYEIAASPRDFMKRLRTHLGDDYCIKVSPWLSRYFMILHIEMYKTSWYISYDNIDKPDYYSCKDQTMTGGTRRSYTRKSRHVKRLVLFEGGKSLLHQRTIPSSRHFSKEGNPSFEKVWKRRITSFHEDMYVSGSM
jgi:hypothetical protein